jgi:16S rRNA processing protein RimM
MTTSQLIALGKITAPHGIRGAVKVLSYCENPTDIMLYKAFMNKKGEPFKIKITKNIAPTLFMATVEGVNTRNDSELLRNIELFISKNELPDLSTNDDVFYHHDLLGLDVYDIDNQELLGVVTLIDNYGAGDILTISKDKIVIGCVPFLKESVPTVDIINKKIMILKRYFIDASPI